MGRTRAMISLMRDSLSRVPSRLSRETARQADPTICRRQYRVQPAASASLSEIRPRRSGFDVADDSSASRSRMTAIRLTSCLRFEAWVMADDADGRVERATQKDADGWTRASTAAH